MAERETIPLDEFLGRLKAQDVAREDLAFICPMCRTVQSMRSLIEAGAGSEASDVEKYIGFSCVGRWTNAGPPPRDEAGQGQGCNWTLGGLLRLHDLEVMTEDGRTQAHFAPASPEQAQALAQQHSASTQ